MKKIYRLLVAGMLLLFAKPSEAQIMENSGSGKTYTQTVDSLFQHLNRDYITTGVLYDRVFPFAALDVFNQPWEGIESTPDTSSFKHYLQAYSELRRASFDTTRLLPDEYLKQLAYAPEYDGAIPIGVLAYRFNLLDSLALREGLLMKRDDGLYYDIEGRSRSPYLERSILVAAPFIETVTVGEVINFKLAPETWGNNTGAEIIYLEIDFGNDLGPVRASTREIVTTRYETTGDKILTITVHFSDGRIAITHAGLTVETKDEIAAKTRPEIPPCSSEIINSTLSFSDYEGITAPGIGDVSYYYSNCNNPTLQKPVIIMDGFDPYDERTGPSLYAVDMAYDGPNNTKQNLAITLQKQGYDVIILNFPLNPAVSPTRTLPLLGQNLSITLNREKAGADYIERNAYVLIELIKKVNAKLAQNGSTEKLVVVGPSMGGLISRYALAFMEKMLSQKPNDANWKKEWDHNTRLWISFDSPHLGANVPVGDQHFLDFYARKNGNTSAITSRAKLTAPAAKQMLVHLYSDGSSPNSSANWVRKIFKTNLTNNGLPNSNGFPMNLRKVAVINGSINGTTQSGINACDKAFTCEIKAGGWRYITFLLAPILDFTTLSAAKVYFTPDYGNSCKVFEGTYPTSANETKDAYTPGGTMGYDRAPGGTYSTQKKIKEEGTDLKFWSMTQVKFYSVINQHSFIPTKSSLAFKGANQDLGENLSNRNLVCSNETPFDDYYAPNVNEEHIALTSGSVAFIQSELDYKPKTQVADVPKFVNSGSWFGIGKTRTISVTHPYATSYDWEATGGFKFSNNQTTLTGVGASVNVVAPATCFNNGDIKVKANTTRCGTSTVVSKHVYTGATSVPELMNIPSWTCAGDRILLTGFVTDGGPAFFDYEVTTVPSGLASIITSGSSKYLLVRNSVTSGTIFLTVTSENECGEMRNTYNIPVSSCGGMQRQIEAYPNPANSSFDVTVIEPTDSTGSNVNSTDVEFDAELYDKFIQKVKTGKSKDGKLKIHTNGLIPGIYYLNVFKGNDVLRKQIVVE